MNPESENHIVFPGGLSERDIELIKLQCQNQNANSNEQILGFALAYAEAKKLSEDEEKLKNLTPNEVVDIIARFAFLIEKENIKGFRTVPVRFKDFSQALPPANIERAIGSFAEAFASDALTPIEAYTEFEKIHPFEDGNGRLGDLLWKVATTKYTKIWPEELPPDVFKERD